MQVEVYLQAYPICCPASLLAMSGGLALPLGMLSGPVLWVQWKPDNEREWGFLAEVSLPCF